MAETLDEDVVTELAASGLGLVSGTNLFTGPERSVGDGIPDQAVFVLATGGAPPAPFIDGSGVDYCWSTVQITVRSAVRSFHSGQALARSVRNAIHEASISGYVDVRAREAEPNYLGADEQEMHTWTINVEMEHRR
jgi:hypothetical protein